MKSYLSYFKLRLITSLQYRAAALAGMCAQIFFGVIFIFVYLAFYESGSGNAPMQVEELVNYLWLNQIFFAIVCLWYTDRDLFQLIKTGNIAYELCRPQSIYWMWYVKTLASRIANVTLRCLPVMIIAFLLPKPYGLTMPANLESFLLFLVAFIIGAFLSNAIIMIFHVITFFTLDEKGISHMIIAIADILSGLVVPILFFPKFLQTISDYLPFRYVSDLAFRVYSGSIIPNEAIFGIAIEIAWAIIITLIGLLITKVATKKLVVQGG